ncbi:MAG: UDP-N-acetylmuramoyl-L-alanyl-D-glutamate--2,6-diaminopimelate ligase [Thermodesulfovibrio sp.]|nr:UDP-N-acetylmuramoyl-L-alanyl-D-glutamate--2,6-diaminopimelate ligase [Thermodesulfovibrio sp.]
MRLGEIMQSMNIIELEGDERPDIQGLSYDSRTTQPGDLFVALPGGHVNGHDFIPQAIEKGAVAVMYQGQGVSCKGQEKTGTAFVRVADSRKALAIAANNFYARPSQGLHLIGVTGTNGKTTTTCLIKSILEQWGKTVGLIGTIQHMIGHEAYASIHTTPEAPEFQQLLQRMRAAGCTHAVAEVSSHALAQQRVEATVFRTVVFTNLTQDHLDFHKTMEDYFLAKAGLFSRLLSDDGQAVINYDDAYGRRLWEEGRRGYSYGLDAAADIRAEDIRNTPAGLKFSVCIQGRIYPAESSLIGLHNVYNILAAIGAGLAVGVPMEVILMGISSAGNVKGRFERVDVGQPFLAVVDFAHTEDALERTIQTARALTEGRVITVFGCGGDRDRGKRPRMGEVATRLSDLVVITSDNPRSEDPGAIIRDIEAGAVRKNYLVEPDRKKAILLAVQQTRKEDLLLIAGKGHEEYQETGGKKQNFSDREVLQETIRHCMNRA